MIPDWEMTGVVLSDQLQVRHPELSSHLTSILTSHGIEVVVATGTRDIWAKDYSPVQIGPSRFVSFRYEPDYLQGHANLRTGREILASFQPLGECKECDINLDGGNVVSGRSRAIVTDKIYRENSTRSRVQLREELCRVLEIDRLIVIGKEPYDPIGHSDAIVRFVTEHSVVVNDYHSIDPAFGDRLHEVLNSNGLEIETLPYFHDRGLSDGIPSAVGCYINFLLTRKVLVVPAFQHPLDGTALATLRKLFPGLSVESLDCSALAREGGVLNCICAGFCRI